jgi:hypothetical protein
LELAWIAAYLGEEEAALDAGHGTQTLSGGGVRADAAALKISLLDRLGLRL